jgi:hypothetical protein
LKNSLKEDSFATLNEDRIDFAPTYKLKPKTDTYDTSKSNRVPSWCDRILYKLNRADHFIQCKSLSYVSLPVFTQSDHKPVCGLFDVRVLNWQTEMPAIMFMSIRASSNQNLDIAYKVSKDVFTHTRDWIGVYRVRCIFDYFQ